MRCSRKGGPEAGLHLCRLDTCRLSGTALHCDGSHEQKLQTFGKLKSLGRTNHSRNGYPDKNRTFTSSIDPPTGCTQRLLDCSVAASTKCDLQGKLAFTVRWQQSPTNQPPEQPSNFPIRLVLPSIRPGIHTLSGQLGGSINSPGGCQRDE